MRKICPACSNTTIEELFIKLPFFRHLDFTTVSNDQSLFKCSKCQIVFNPIAIKTETPTFKTEQYAESNQTKQKMNVDGFSEPVTRSFLQSKILSEQFVNNETVRILDIGCFDGCLLNEFDAIFSNADLWGFDTNSHLEALFPKKENFHFISSGLDAIQGYFDIITLSHSIYYIPDLSKLMGFIGKLLKTNGILFSQIPDIRKNLFYSLMGDQCLIFTEKSLVNVLGHFGYKAGIIKNNFFSRELLVEAKIDESSESKTYEEDNVFNQNIQAINDFKRGLQLISHDNLTVLGTTVTAAFVDEIIGERIEFFVDEEPKTKKIFRGKKVIHPKDLNESNHTILPYGKSGIKIQERFQSMYNGSFGVL